MNLFMTAVDGKTYAELKPFIDRLAEIDMLQFKKRQHLLPEGTTIDPMRLMGEQESIIDTVLDIGRHRGIHKDTISDVDQELDALMDLISAIEHAAPQKAPLLKAIGDFLIAKDALPDLLQEFRQLLKSLNIETLIMKRNEGIPPEAYNKALSQKIAMMNYCAEKGYALFTMVEGD